MEKKFSRKRFLIGMGLGGAVVIFIFWLQFYVDIHQKNLPPFVFPCVALFGLLSAVVGTIFGAWHAISTRFGRGTIPWVGQRFHGKKEEPTPMSAGFGAGFALFNILIFTLAIAIKFFNL